MSSNTNKATKLGGKIWFCIAVFGLVGQLAWVIENMYFNVYLFDVIGGTATDIATMVAASAITAAATTLIMGALSDKIGKRKIFITVGYIIWGLVTASFGLITLDNTSKLFHTVNIVAATAMIIVIMDCVMTFFGSTASDAAFNSWVTDITDDTNRGRAEAVLQAMPLVSMLLVFGVLDGFKQNGQWDIFFYIVGGMTTVCGIIGLFVLKDKPGLKVNNENYFKNIVYGFRPSTVKANKMLYITFAVFCILNIAYQVFMPYIIIYLEKCLGITDYAIPLGAILVLAAIFSVVMGRVIDKYGKSKFMIPAIIILIGGFVGMYFMVDVPLALLIVVGTIMMGAFLVTSATVSGSIRDYTPDDKVGLFQGVRMVFQVLIPMVVGPYIGAAVIANNSETYIELGVEKKIPTPNIFLAAAVVGLFAIIPAIVLLKKTGKNQSKNQ